MGRLNSLTPRRFSQALQIPSSPGHCCFPALVRRVRATARPAILFQSGAEAEVFAKLVLTFTFGDAIVAVLLARVTGLRKVLGVGSILIPLFDPDASFLLVPACNAVENPKCGQFPGCCEDLQVVHQNDVEGDRDVLGSIRASDLAEPDGGVTGTDPVLAYATISVT